MVIQAPTSSNVSMTDVLFVVAVAPPGIIAMLIVVLLSCTKSGVHTLPRKIQATTCICFVFENEFPRLIASYFFVSKIS